MALRDREIPKYTLSEELISAISHGVGVIFSIAALVIGIVFSVMYNNAICVVSMAIYGSTLIILYSMSTLYHSLGNNAGKRVFRIIDHCSIFLLIAGSYTPIILVAINGVIGWTMFGVVWGAAILGVVLNAIDLKKFSKFSMICYMAMGWIVVFIYQPFVDNVAPTGIWLLAYGGIAYTIGAIIYGFGKKKKYLHSIWHFFVLTGSVLHYFCILFYVVLNWK